MPKEYCGKHYMHIQQLVFVGKSQIIEGLQQKKPTKFLLFLNFTITS